MCYAQRMTRYSDYIDDVNGHMSRYPAQRYGQAAMNVLRDWDPTLYMSISGTPLDVFHNEYAITEFFALVHSVLDNHKPE